MNALDVLAALAADSRAAHAHYAKECPGGCPAMLYIRQAEALTGGAPLTWKEWQGNYLLSLSEFVPVGARVDYDLVMAVCQDVREIPDSVALVYLLCDSDYPGPDVLRFAGAMKDGERRWVFIGAEDGLSEEFRRVL